MTSDLSSSPANDQMLLVRKPSTHGPGVVSRTTEGPADHLSVPRVLSVAVGKEIIGPTPQMTFPALAGDRKRVVFISPSPNTPPLLLVTSG